MRFLIAMIALVGVLGFSSFVRAADSTKANNASYARATRTGIFEKIDGKNVIYKGGAKGTGKEWTVPTDEKAKVTIDGKDALLSDLKPGQQLKLTFSKEHVITKVEATTPKK
jgi:hypothetical protein